MAKNTKLIEDALDALLTAILDERHKQDMHAAAVDRLREAGGAEPRRLEVISAFDLAKQPLPSRMDCALSRIVKNPIEGSLMFAVRQIGEHLFKTMGSTDAMLYICNRVCARHPDTENYRSAIVDHRWDGIGNANDVWAC